ncbi:MAG: hypothetical protein Q4F66_00580 [Clostridium sp.]|nr:hypothetical protein [Clostridium sp.]
MQEEINFEILEIPTIYNYLRFTFTNKSGLDDCVTIFIYDGSTPIRTLVYENSFFVPNRSEQIVVIPLLIENYDDLIVLTDVQVAYTTVVGTRVKTQLLYGFGSNE